MDTTLTERLIDAARRGDAAEVERLLRYNSVRPAHNNSIALRWAAFRGHDKVVKLILNDGRANPADRKSEALWLAAKHGRVKVVRLLLRDGRANRTSHALRIAAKNGHVRVVKALLTDGRADPAAGGSRALMDAIQGRHTEVVALLERAIPMRKRWNNRWNVARIILHVSICVIAR